MMKDSRLQKSLYDEPADAVRWAPPPGYDGKTPDCYCHRHGFYNVPRGNDNLPMYFEAGCPGCKREEAYDAFKAPLLDAFAMAALQGIMIGNTATPEFAAASAYRVARAMMAERDKGR